MLDITITQHTTRTWWSDRTYSKARLTNRPGLWANGSTTAEAVGKLCIASAAQLGLTFRTPRGPL